jgi:hypothetical protein
MADGVVATGQIKLHQALHGYAEGHRQLASSVTLKPQDTKTVLVLSDISGPGVRIGQRGYLTGYPLVDAGMYAIARTWAAPEMPRPGCVWTHTLFMDFAELAVLRSPSELLRLFRRPESADLTGYDKPLFFQFKNIASSIHGRYESYARTVVGALYGKPDAQITAFRSEEVDTDAVITAIWSQQWPRLRRTFRFCTLAATDRSLEGIPFDLQLLPAGNPTLRTRFPKTIDAEPSSASGEWLETAVADLIRPEVNGLRDFLQQVGGDVGGRAAFPSLCILYRLTQSFESDPASLERAVAVLQNELGATRARTVRKIVTTAALLEADRLDDPALDFLLNELTSTDFDDLPSRIEPLGRAILSRRPAALISMLNSKGAAAEISKKIIEAAAPEELSERASESPALLRVVLQLRPKLAAEPAFWSYVGARELLEVLRKSTDRVPILKAIIDKGRIDLANRVVAEVGALELLRAINALSTAGKLSESEREKWLRFAADPWAVAELFSQKAVRPEFLVSIARIIGPDEIPNDYGEDPWFTAMKRTNKGMSAEDEVYLRAYLLARALGPRSRSQAKLAKVGFETTHGAAAENRLCQDSWRWLESRLPWSLLWFDWDRCQRLRAAVVNLFVHRALAPDVFADLVQDNSLFGTLAEEANRTIDGQAYLKMVSKALKERPGRVFAARRRFIESLMK